MTPVWRTSTYSGGNGDCVEVAGIPTAVLVRDSKASTIPPPHFHQFLKSVNS